MKSIQKLCAWQTCANDEKLSKVVCGVVFTKGECTRLCKGQPRANGLVCDINFHVLKTPDRVAPHANGLVISEKLAKVVPCRLHVSQRGTNRKGKTEN